MTCPYTIPDAQNMRSQRLQLVTAERQLKDGLSTVSKALQTLDNWENGAADWAGSGEATDQTVAIMRERGGAGLPSKIDCDPELRSFILSHIYRLPYAEIARMVAERFPPHRRTSRSAISRWWTKERPNSTASDAP